MTHQATQFHARERNRSFRDATRDLFKTHDLPRLAGVIDTDVVFPDPVRDSVFTISIEGTPSTGESTLITLGGGGEAQLTLGYTNGDLVATAGGPDADDTIDLGASSALILDKFQTIVFAVRPGTGEGRLWIDGLLFDRATSVNGSFGGPFAGPGDGSVAVSTPAALARVQAFTKQIPRHFNA